MEARPQKRGQKSRSDCPAVLFLLKVTLLIILGPSPFVWALKNDVQNVYVIVYRMQANNCQILTNISWLEYFIALWVTKEFVTMKIVKFVLLNQYGVASFILGHDSYGDKV